MNKSNDNDFEKKSDSFANNLLVISLAYHLTWQLHGSLYVYSLYNEMVNFGTTEIAKGIKSYKFEIISIFLLSNTTQVNNVILRWISYF